MFSDSPTVATGSRLLRGDAAKTTPMAGYRRAVGLRSWPSRQAKSVTTNPAGSRYVACRGVRIHEAGHCVAAGAMGMTVESVSVDRRVIAGHHDGECCIPSLNSPRDAQHARRCATVMLAGGEAERLFAAEHFDEHSSADDVRRAERMLIAWNVCTTFGMAYVIGQLRGVATQLLLHHADAVCVVADALRDRGTMNRDALDRLFRQYNIRQ